MTRIELQDIALTSDARNWTCQRWTPLGDGAKSTKDTLIRDGVRGYWRDTAFYPTLGDALRWMHGEAVKTSDAQSLDALACAVQDAARVLAAAVGAFETRRVA